MFLLTPDDSGITPFQIGRAPDKGDELIRDEGQIIGPTDGTRVFVYQDRVSVRTVRINFSGLRDFEFLSLLEYLNRELQGGAEPFTMETGYGWNRVPDSERLDAAGWSATGSSAPTVNSRAANGAWGYPLSADRVDFASGQSVLRASNCFEVGGESGTVYVSFLARVVGGAGALSGNVNSDGVASAAWSVPFDGAWHDIRVSYSDPTQHWVDWEITGGPRNLAMQRVQVTLDIPWPRFERAPRTTLAGCRFIAGSLSATQQHGLYNAALLVRQEVTS